MVVSNKKKRSNFNPLNLSFLDIMSCGLGAVILIFLILRHGESNSPEENSRILDDIEMAKASMHETKIKISNESQKIINLKNTIQTIKNERVTLKQTILNETSLKERSLKQNKAIGTALKDLESEKPDIVEVKGEGERQYLTGLKVEGKRILLILDSSASMLDESIINIIQKSFLSDQVKEASDKWVRAKKILKWLVARLPLESQFSILTFNERVKSHTQYSWLSATDGPGTQISLNDAFKEIPQKGTNLEKALVIAAEMNPKPDSVYLITDGLPTKGEPIKGINKEKLNKCFRIGSKKNPVRNISSECRLELFKKALRAYVKDTNIKTSVILLPIEGDPKAAASFWALSNRTKGTLISPSQDWP